jgi:hypothetical protein
MNKTLSTILIILAATALAAGIFFVGAFYTHMNFYGPNAITRAPGASTGVFGYGYNRNQPNYGYGSGMMSGYGWNNAANLNVTPLTVDQAKAAAEKYLANLNNSDLQIAEVMIFNNNAYVAVKEASTGIGAFELLVNPVWQTAYPEYGPNMMWNQKYSNLNHGVMMGGRGYSGMMGGWNYQNISPAKVSANMPVTKDQAIKTAQAYLDQYQPGTVAANDPMQFYGYYTLDFSKDGKVLGMLSVNGYSRQIFLHTWHGSFIEEAQVQ